MKPSEASQAYQAIAEELSGDIKLYELNQSDVAKARAYAKRSHKRWPPRPVNTGIQMSITSFTLEP